MLERGNGKEPVQNHESILARDFVDLILQGARENLNTHGSLVATVFARLDHGERAIIPLSLPETHEEKRFYFTLLGLSIRAMGRTISEAILVSESWYVEADKSSDPLQTAPSEHPNRKEAITLAGRDSRNQYFVFAIQPFHRDSHDRPVFESLFLKEYNEEPDSGYFATRRV
jgi:hypothetical protein